MLLLYFFFCDMLYNWSQVALPCTYFTFSGYLVLLGSKLRRTWTLFGFVAGFTSELTLL